MTYQYPKRIICLTEEFTEIICLLGREDIIVGVSGFTVRPKGIRKRIPTVSTFIDAKYDVIDKLAPDIIFGFSDLQADICKELISRGHNVVCFNQRSVDEILRVILIVGNIIGEHLKAEHLATSLCKKIDTLRNRDVLDRKRVYFEEWYDPIISGIRWVEELIEIAGGSNVFPNLKDKKLAKDRVLSADAVREANPDIIIASLCGKQVKKDKIIDRKGWDTINAVKNNYIYEIPSSIILQPGPAALTDGLDMICEIIAQSK
jgi:iron complex transport system substrate-binding protein